MSTKIIVLAAGKGTRMKSAFPKVLHKIAGISMLQNVLNTVATLDPEEIYTVIGHGSKQVIDQISSPVVWVNQKEQKGTGHAVQQALSHIQPTDIVVIAYGDVPLTKPETFINLHKLCEPKTLGLLTVILEDPTGYGRIVRDDNNLVTGIVEHKDATEPQKLINEINTGMLSIYGADLHNLLAQITNDNSQGEYYLTEIFALAVNQGMQVRTCNPEHEWEVAGVNSRKQLAELERIHQGSIAEQLMEQGVTLADPARIDVRGKLTVSQDVEIDVNVVFNGEVSLAEGVQIGPGCIISDSSIAAYSKILPNSVIDSSVVGANCTVGPFARLRPGTVLSDEVHIGNFVEIKNSNISDGSKVNHLSYIGDSDIAELVNIGAGTITCNYDGAFKHRTTIEKEVHIGSNSALVAPVTIKAGATVGAGSVITREIAENQLALTRGKLKQVDNWQRPRKTNKKGN